MNLARKVISGIAGLLCSTALSGTISSRSFAPENQLHLEDTRSARTNVTESDFNGAIDDALAMYVPIFQRFGLEFVIERNWEDSTVNAYAYREGNKAVVAMFGGLARRDEVTLNGFIMVICHEIGHHLGGYPFVQEWASNEGNSDYYAAMACARKMIDTYIPATNETIADQRCRAQSKDPDSCIAIAHGAYSTANLLATIGGSRKPSALTPDRTVVRQTINTHPNAQCRLDTMLSADLCPKEWNDALIPMDSRATCQRPRCWFAR